MKQFRKPSAGRTNIVLDSKLVERVKRLAKVKTTRDAVHVALEHYVRSRDYSEFLHCAARAEFQRAMIRRRQAPPGDAKCSSILRYGSRTYAVTIWSKSNCLPKLSSTERPSGLLRPSCRKFFRVQIALIGSTVGIGCLANCLW